VGEARPGAPKGGSAVTGRTPSSADARVPVRDPDGHVLTPCSLEKADQNVRDGLAVMADGVLLLKYRPLAYRRIFRRVLARDGLTCAWCQEAGSTLDHVIPVSYGGQAALDNCVVACRACNHMRHNALPSQFIAATGFVPTHPLILHVLAHEARMVRSTRRALRHRPIEACRSKEEAQVWLESREGQGPWALAAAPATWATRYRRRTAFEPVDPYVP
jgi:hypothetical protein